MIGCEMKKIIIIALCLLFWWPRIASADPSLSCDPQAEVTAYRMTIEGIDYEEDSVANPDGSGNHDLAPVPAGEHQAEFRAGKEWTLDGVPQGVYDWSGPTLFSLGRPEKPNAPVGNRIVSP